MEVSRKGEITPSLDKQEDVYKMFLQELDEAVRVLNQYGTDKKILY